MIASVLNQPYQDMELVVSDNASDPETRAVVSKFFGDRRLTYVRLDQGFRLQSPRTGTMPSTSAAVSTSS